MSRLYGYIRSERYDSNLSRQRQALEEFGVSPNFTFAEFVQGARTRRPQLESCLAMLDQGDSLVVRNLNDLARSLDELHRVLGQLIAVPAFLIVTQNSLDGRNLKQEEFRRMVEAILSFQNEIISRRTKAGIQAAKREGRNVGGSKPKLTQAQFEFGKLLLARPDYTIAKVAKELRVSKATLHRYLKADREGYSVALDAENFNASTRE